MEDFGILGHTWKSLKSLIDIWKFILFLLIHFYLNSFCFWLNFQRWSIFFIKFFWIIINFEFSLRKIEILIFSWIFTIAKILLFNWIKVYQSRNYTKIWINLSWKCIWSNRTNSKNRGSFTIQLFVKWISCFV